MSDQHNPDIFTKTQAKDLLSDLLGIAPKETLFGDLVPAKPIKATPKWIPKSLVIVSVTHTCTCGQVHIHTSPKLLLREDYVDYTGRILYSEETSNPKSLRSGEFPSDFVIEEQTVSGEPLPFCSSCVTTCNQDSLKRMFFLQASEYVNPENDLRRTAVEALSESSTALLTDLL